MPRHLLLLASVLVAAGLATAAVPAAPPARYYLALGDSVAWGYGARTARAIATGTPPPGYVAGVAAALRAHGHPVRVVNLGCPGETTRSFVSGRCAWAAGGSPMHRAYEGSQLDAATAFLRAHPRVVSPITLTLWANDVAELAGACSGDPGCLRRRAPAAIAALAARVGAILRTLRAAAPGAELIVTGTWNADPDRLAEGDPPLRALDLALGRAASAAGARFADTFPVFNPQGDARRERAAICRLTLGCSRGDEHPSEAGYRAIAALIARVSTAVRG
jgi:lysophospholipase L1-like esterase